MREDAINGLYKRIQYLEQRVQNQSDSIIEMSKKIDYLENNLDEMKTRIKSLKIENLAYFKVISQK